MSENLNIADETAEQYDQGMAPRLLSGAGEDRPLLCAGGCPSVHAVVAAGWPSCWEAKELGRGAASKARQPQ